ncbi:MAG: amino acid adenylation domain-containing protein [Cyanobacteria bacterium J06635_15]
MQDLSIEGFRLSPQQKRLWQQQVSADGSYYAFCSILIEGDLQTEKLGSALQRIIRRHEILRTNFQTLPGMRIPLQVIAGNVEPLISEYDFRELSPTDQFTQLQLLCRQKNHQTFDLEQGSLFDISLVALDARKYLLLICLPALCADRATLDSLVQEISHDYAVCLYSQELSDELQPLQYADLAEWQNELFEGEEAKLGREYWQKKKDSMAFANCQLNFENPTTSKLDFKPELFSLYFSAEQLVELDAIAAKHDASISELLQTCWYILLWRVTKSTEITIGTYCDGRNYEEIESALGLFSKFLPIYCHLEDQFRFSDVLKQTGEIIDEAFKWQDSFAWDQIAEFSEKVPETSFFAICFEFEEQSEIHSASDISFSIDKQYVCFDQFKVKLSCVRNSRGLSAELSYDSSLFRVDVIERLAGQFQKLIESVINKPESAIGQLEILSDCDRDQLLIGFNQTQIDYPPNKGIHELFETQANNSPNQIAVVFENQQLTYAELNLRANQLAHYLQKLGVGSEVVVGLYVERSLELIVGLLGILKAGGAYLPLDPALPQERVAFRLQDAQVSVLLSQQQLVEALPEGETRLVCLDSQWKAIAQESGDNLRSEVRAENLAYVLFTSGSTGKPKGVAIEHRQLLNYTNAITQKLELSGCTSFATVSTFAADLGNTVIFPALCQGGSLHVISPERVSNPEALADYFSRHAIDCLKIVPSHLAALLTASQPEQILPQRRLILGGEVCRWKLIEQIQSYAPNCLIFNHYGPTEATVGVLTYSLSAETPHPAFQQGETVPIGRPIANTQIYLLDTYLQPVPIGVPGEIYIGGAGLARGYFNRPNLTQERFIPNPFNNSKFKIQSSKLYRTGDLGRYLPDGNIEFLGRVDHQVKIHGFRIELGEIEVTLRQHPAVQETAVLAREDPSGNQRLVAYLVPNKQSKLTTSELRSFLQEKLPEYMVPAIFVLLKAIPLTPNGKIDRQALPEPEATRSGAARGFVAPRTGVEKVLADVWAQTLRLEKIGIHDNFFELGGDSILSIQIISRAHQAGLKLTPKQLFEHQTIAELAAVATTAKAVQAQQGLVIGQVPLTPIQHWFFEQSLPESHHWNQSILLEVRQALDLSLLKLTVQTLLEHHDALRLRFVLQESGWQQSGSHPDAMTPLTWLDLSTVSDAEQSLAITAAATELQASLSLSAGPLVQVAYFDLGANRSARLLWIVHHLAVDGVSWRILLEDFQQVYAQLSQGQKIHLPSKTTSFQYWAKRLQDYGQSEALQQESDYWLRQAGHTVIPIPVDFSDGENTVAVASVVSTALSQADTQALLQEVPQAYQTQINDVLLTALLQAFAQWTGSCSLLVDLEGHGREDLFDDVDLSRTVGWFTTLFPVHLQLEDLTHLGEALKTIKEQLRRIPKRGIGYGVLRYLNDKTLTSWLHQPQAEIRFNYLGQIDQGFQGALGLALGSESGGAERSLAANRSYLLDINGIVAGGQLRLNWTYSKAIHQRATVETLAERCMEALRSLITHCQSSDAGGYTPSDFQKARVTQKDLDQLLSQINRGS